MGDKIIRKMSEEETDQFLRKKFFEESDLIEKALLSDDLDNSSENDIEVTEEQTEAAYQKLLGTLKESGVYREENESVRESKIISDVFTDIKIKESAPEEEREADTDVNLGKVAEIRGHAEENTKSAARSRRLHGITRAAAIGVVCVLGIFAASMTGEANRRYFINNVRYLAGDDTRMIISNDENNDKSEKDEYEARAEIENVLGIEVPEFWYRPQHFGYYNCTIDAKIGIADVQYTYNDCIIAFTVRKKNDERSSGNYSIIGNQEEQVIDIPEEDIKVSIWEIKETGDEKSTCIAQWYKDDVSYQISGKIDKEILIRIIQNIKY